MKRINAPIRAARRGGHAG